MPIVTLTTDFGHSDVYSGRFKGRLLSLNSDINIIDITHQIPPFNIVVGSFSLKYTFSSFPKGTYHIIRVDEKDIEKSGLLMTFCNGHYFIAPDNGLLPTALGNKMEWVRTIDFDKFDNFNTDEIYAQVLNYMIANVHFEYSEPISNYVIKNEWAVIKEEKSLRGMVVLVDYFGNLLTNIHVTDLLPYNEKYDIVKIVYRPNEVIHGLVGSYDDVKNGDAMCRINDLGFMEIAVNRGSAASYLGIKFGHQVTIDFE